MRIVVKRLGGFAGVEQDLASADLNTLPPSVADQLRKSIEQLDMLTAGGPRSEGADQFRYVIEIAESGTPRRAVTVVDEGDPEQPAIKQVRAILGLLGAQP